MAVTEGTCVAIARRSTELADRMWSTVTVGDQEVTDDKMREVGRRLCAECPVRSVCLGDALAGGWKDRNIIGGLDYRGRTVLAQVIAEDMSFRNAGVDLHELSSIRVRDWLDAHPQWPSMVSDRDRSYWRERKKMERRRRPDMPPDPRPFIPMPAGTAVQPTLFDE